MKTISLFNGLLLPSKVLSAGVTADDNGEFVINAPSDGTLVISAINYATQEVNINNNNSLEVKLSSLEKTETEVIVVGYGTQRKRDVTGAIVKVNSDVLLQTPSHNVIDQLKGHAAGVNITSTSAVPGGGSQIRIRGNRTMVANTAPNQVTGSTLAHRSCNCRPGGCAVVSGRWNSVFGQSE